MHKIVALALLGLTALTAPAWSQANLRPDPDPRVPTQPGQALPHEDALFLKEAALASQGQPERTDAFGAAGAVSNPENAREGMAQEAVQSLSGASGEAFGKGYVEAQLRLHDRLVDLYQTEASHTPNRELATFAITSLVEIQKDRDALRQMAGRFGIEAAPAGQAIQYGDPTKAR